MSVTVSLTWIPGHTGIEYNEKADQLAKVPWLGNQIVRLRHNLSCVQESDSEEDQQTVARKMGQVAYR